MARRYRYAFAKKKRSFQGKMVCRTCGGFQLFGRKPETQDEHGRVYFEWSDPGYLAGTFFIGGITDG